MLTQREREVRQLASDLAELARTPRTVAPQPPASPDVESSGPASPRVPNRNREPPSGQKLLHQGAGPESSAEPSPDMQQTGRARKLAAEVEADWLRQQVASARAELRIANAETQELKVILNPNRNTLDPMEVIISQPLQRSVKNAMQSNKVGPMHGLRS